MILGPMQNFNDRTHSQLLYIFQMSKTLEESPNARINKSLSDRYLTLPFPDGKIIATYIWIDGTDENVRCKDRTLEFIPKSPKGKHYHFILSYHR